MEKELAETGDRDEGCVLKGRGSGSERIRHHSKRPSKTSGHAQWSFYVGQVPPKKQKVSRETVQYGNKGPNDLALQFTSSVILVYSISKFPRLSKWGPDHTELSGRGEEFALFLRSNARPVEA